MYLPVKAKQPVQCTKNEAADCDASYISGVGKLANNCCIDSSSNGVVIVEMVKGIAKAKYARWFTMPPAFHEK